VARIPHSLMCRSACSHREMGGGRPAGEGLRALNPSCCGALPGVALELGPAGGQRELCEIPAPCISEPCSEWMIPERGLSS
jgi:hypothetical protein